MANREIPHAPEYHRTRSLFVAFAAAASLFAGGWLIGRNVDRPHVTVVCCQDVEFPAPTKTIPLEP